jgi:hypothetical protein
MEGQNEQTNAWAEQFSGMGNFAMTIWNSTCNPYFSTFDQILLCFMD